MQNNPEIEQLIEQAIRLAKEKQHEYVLTEHLLLALIRPMANSLWQKKASSIRMRKYIRAMQKLMPTLLLVI